MGVAQSDRECLWPFLSPRQHMTLFCGLKGVPTADIEPSSTALLEKFRLTDV